MKKVFCAVLPLLLALFACAGCFTPNIIDTPDTEYEVSLDVDPDIEATLRILVPTTDGGRASSAAIITVEAPMLMPSRKMGTRPPSLAWRNQAHCWQS